MTTKTVGSGGGRDYATIALYESYLDGLVVLTQPEIAELYNDSEFSEAVTFSGWVASAVNDVTLRPASGQGFRDNPANKLRYDQSQGVAWRAPGGGTFGHVTVSSAYVTFFGMQFKNAVSGYSGYCIDVQAIPVVTDSCILFSDSGGGRASIGSAVGTIKQSLIYTTNNSDTNVRKSGFATVNIFGCTFARTSDITPTGTALTDPGYGWGGTMKNSAIFGSTTVWSGTWGTTPTYCATDQASFPQSGTGDVTSLAYTSQFANPAAGAGLDFKALSSGGLKAGTPDSTNSPVDIFGTPRDATTPYIGCYEVPGGSATTFTVTLTGAISFQGTLLKQTSKLLSGGLTFTGTTSKQTNKSLSGSMTPTGALSKQTNKLLAGTATFAGALAKQTNKLLTGSLSFAGGLLKQTNKLLTGAVTFTGTLSTIKTFIVNLAGSLSFSGSLSKQTNKLLSGSIAPVGTLLKQTNKLLTGSLTFVGTCIKQTRKLLSGTLSFVGGLVAVVAGFIYSTLFQKRILYISHENRELSVPSENRVLYISREKDN